MLSKNIQHRIILHTFLSFKLNKIIFPKSKLKKQININNKYETFTKENFIIICLYTLLYNQITDLYTFYNFLNSYTDDDLKIIFEKKKKLKHNKLTFKNECEFLYNKYGKFITFRELHYEFRKETMQWFTFLYLIIFFDYLNENIQKREYTYILKKVIIMNKFVPLKASRKFFKEFFINTFKTPNKVQKDGKFKNTNFQK